jgi:hypothetical protein
MISSTHSLLACPRCTAHFYSCCAPVNCVVQRVTPTDGNTQFWLRNHTRRRRGPLRRLDWTSSSHTRTPTCITLQVSFKMQIFVNCQRRHLATFDDAASVETVRAFVEEREGAWFYPPPCPDQPSQQAHASQLPFTRCFTMLTNVDNAGLTPAARAWLVATRSNDKSVNLLALQPKRVWTHMNVLLLLPPLALIARLVGARNRHPVRVPVRVRGWPRDREWDSRFAWSRGTVHGHGQRPHGRR